MRSTQVELPSLNKHVCRVELHMLPSIVLDFGRLKLIWSFRKCVGNWDESRNNRYHMLDKDFP